MALDATPGGASADSYISLADADAIAAREESLEAENWRSAAATTERRENALKWATADLDLYLRTAYAPYSGTQALRFPRADVDVVSDSPVIPKNLEDATYHLAAFYLLNAKVVSRRDARKARGQRQYAEHGTSATEDSGNAPGWPDAVMRAIAGFRTVGSSAERSIGSVRLDGGFVGIR